MWYLSGENCLPDYWAENENLSVSLVNGLYQTETISHLQSEN